MLVSLTRRVSPLELSELVMELSPSLVLASGVARLGQPAGTAPFARFGQSVRAVMPAPARIVLCDTVRAALPRLARADRHTAETFISFVSSGLPGPPGAARDALSLTAQVRLMGWLATAPSKRLRADRLAVELVVAALGVAALGTIRGGC